MAGRIEVTIKLHVNLTGRSVKCDQTKVQLPNHHLHSEMKGKVKSYEPQPVAGGGCVSFGQPD